MPWYNAAGCNTVNHRDSLLEETVRSGETHVTKLGSSDVIPILFITRRLRDTAKDWGKVLNRCPGALWLESHVLRDTTHPRERHPLRHRVL